MLPAQACLFVSAQTVFHGELALSRWAPPSPGGCDALAGHLHGGRALRQPGLRAGALCATPGSGFSGRTSRRDHRRRRCGHRRQIHHRRRASQLPPPPSASTNTLTPPTSSSSGHTSPTSPTFSTHHAQHQAQRSALRSMPPGPPPLGLPPPPPTTTQAKGAVTLAAPPTSAARKGRRGSEPILQGPGVGRGEMRRPSLGLETLPEVTVSPPTNTTTGVTGHGGNLAGYRPVSFRAELKKVRVQGEAPPAAATEE